MNRSTGRSGSIALVVATALGSVLLVLGLGPDGPAGPVAAHLSPSLYPDLILGGIVLLGLVATALALVVVTKTTAFLLHLAFHGGDALDDLPEMDPLVRVALGIVLLIVVLLLVTLYMTESPDTSHVPFVGDDGEATPAADATVGGPALPSTGVGQVGAAVGVDHVVAAVESLPAAAGIG